MINMYELETTIFQDTLLNKEYLKEYLIRKNKKKYQCDICGLNEWQNEPLSLILNFKDRNESNQNIENLQFLCPNCYSQVGYK